MSVTALNRTLVRLSVKRYYSLSSSIIETATCLEKKQRDRELASQSLKAAIELIL